MTPARGAQAGRRLRGAVRDGIFEAMRSSFGVLRTALLVVSLGAAACSAASRGPSRSGDVISRADLDQLAVTNAYEAVERLRPQWLNRPTAPTFQASGNPILVYVDRQRMGDLEQLRNIALDAIQEIRFVSARDATTRYGTGHPSGVIEVTTRTH